MEDSFDKVFSLIVSVTLAFVALLFGLIAIRDNHSATALIFGYMVGYQVSLAVDRYHILTNYEKKKNSTTTFEDSP